MVPLGWPAAAALALVVFALIIGEVGATSLVAPPGTTMISIRIFTLLHYGIYYDVAGAALVMIVPMALIGYAVCHVAGRMLKA